MRITSVDGWWPKGLIWLLMATMIFSWLTSLGIRHKARSETDENRSSRRPNVLLIVLDDLGYNDVSVLNGNDMPTPTLAALAREGVTFTRHYAEATCSPSRVALLTGKYPQRSGFRPVGVQIPAEYKTIAQALKAVGYSTHMIGKWHVGEEFRSGWPGAKGFDTWFGFLNQWQLGAPHALVDGKVPRPTYRNPWLRQDGGKPVRFRGHLTDILTRRAVSEIGKLSRQDSPWFLYLAYFAPHTPIQPAARFARRFPDTPEGRYRALVAQVDDGIHKVLAKLAHSGEADDTLVIVLSDNGGTNKQRDNNYPFYGKKNGVYEGSFRTPMFMRWPGKLHAGKVVRDPVMNVDIYPTIMGALGLPPPQLLDGVNLMPSLLGKRPIPERVRSWENYHWSLDSLGYSILSADGHWRLSGLFGLGPELYDLQADPSGQTNVATEYPHIVAQLKSEFLERHDAERIIPVKHVRVGADTVYTGFDFMRTPYRYGFALGLGVGPFTGLTDSGKTYVIAEQKGIWQLRYSVAQGLRWKIGDLELDASDVDPGRCNAVIMTSYFNDQNIIGGSLSRNSVRLYINGNLRSQKFVDRPPSIPLVAIHGPTIVHHSFPGGVTARNDRAVFLNIALHSRQDEYEPIVANPTMHGWFVKAFHDGSLVMPEVGPVTRQLCH